MEITDFLFIIENIVKIVNIYLFLCPKGTFPPCIYLFFFENKIKEAT